MLSNNTRKIALAGLFLAIGFVLPILTAQIKEIGDSLLPMHIPIMLCGLICGAKYGFATGLVLPFLRSLFFSMPPIYPNAVWMSLELAAYGAVIGFVHSRSKNRSISYLYLSLVVSMIMGRVVWGISKALLLGLAQKPFGFKAFIVGGFVDSALGIIIQLVLIPLIMKFYCKELK